MPAESRVHRLVACNRLGGQGADVTISLVELQFSWQIYKGLNHYLVARARSLIPGNAGWIVAACLVFQLHVQVGIGGSQFPAVHWLPIRRHFESFRAALDSVAGKQWNDCMRGRGRRFEKRCPHFKAIEIVVVVVKQSYIHITMRRYQPSIAGFVGDQFLGLELGVAADSQVYGQARDLCPHNL